MKRPSFWEKESFLEPYDLIVIGAGIVGLSAALFYQQSHAGAHILVVDKGPIPEGASTRNAGFACIGSITEHVADMEKETEKSIKKRLLMRYQGLHLLRKTLGDDSIDYKNCGGYELFTDRANFEVAADNIPMFNSWVKDLTGEDHVYVPDTLHEYDVIYNRLEGAIHPGKMIKALIQRVYAAGIMINWNSTVQKPDASGGLRIGDKSIAAKQLLVASNGFSRQLLPDAVIQPARGMIIVSKPWPNLPWKGTFHHNRGYVYFRNVGDRLLLGGGRNVAEEAESTDQFGINPNVKKYLVHFARETLTMPHHLSFEYEWSGIMGFTPSKTPIIQRLDDHRVVAAGLSGMGIAIGMKVAEKVVHLLNERMILKA